MTDELISSPQLLKLYQSQLIMLLMSAQARALQCCLLPTRRHTHTEGSFFSSPNPTDKRMSPVAAMPACGCYLPLFHPPWPPLVAAELCSLHQHLMEGQAKLSSHQCNDGNSGKHQSGFQVSLPDASFVLLLYSSFTNCYLDGLSCSF